MLSAYVLILTEVGKVAQVAHALSNLDGVQVKDRKLHGGAWRGG
jgi:hypothetical protein